LNRRTEEAFVRASRRQSIASPT